MAPTKEEREAHRHRFDDHPCRNDKTVIAELKRWWNAVSHDSDVNAAELNYGGSTKYNKELNKREYSVFYYRLVHAFNEDDHDEESHLNVEEARAALEVDWDNDSGGDGDVVRQSYTMWTPQPVFYEFPHSFYEFPQNRNDFLSSVFELGETWCIDKDGEGDIDPDEIVAYLQELYPKVFECPWSEVCKFWKPSEIA